MRSQGNRPHHVCASSGQFDERGERLGESHLHRGVHPESARLPRAEIVSWQWLPQQVLEEALGRQESDALFETFNEAVDSVVSEIWQYRPDLSYLP